MRDNTRTLSGLIGNRDDYVSITGSAKPERIYGALTTADYFEVLGVQPYLGRTLISTRADERAGRRSPFELQPVAEPLCRRSGDYRKDDPAQSSSVHDRGRGSEGFSGVQRRIKGRYFSSPGDHSAGLGWEPA